MKIQVQISLVGQSTWTNPMWVSRKAGAGGGGGEREGARSQTTSCGFSIAESSRWTIPDPKRWKTGSVTILGGSLSITRLFQMTAQEPV